MTATPTSMRAAVLDAPGPTESFRIRDVPVPVPEPGQVLVKVEAFGLNRSELHTRLGLADGVTFPRVLGIEVTGTVVDCPGGELDPGTQVAGLMGAWGAQTDWRRGRASGEVDVVGSDDAWEGMLIATAQPGADLSSLGHTEPEGRPAAR